MLHVDLVTLLQRALCLLLHGTLSISAGLASAFSFPPFLKGDIVYGLSLCQKSTILFEGSIGQKERSNNLMDLFIKKSLFCFLNVMHTLNSFIFFHFQPLTKLLFFNRGEIQNGRLSKFFIGQSVFFRF